MKEILRNTLSNGIYEITSSNSGDLIVGENQKVVLVDFGILNKKINIELSENSELDFYGIYNSEGSYGAETIQTGNGSKVAINILNLCKNYETKINAKSFLNSNNSESKINVLNLCNDGEVKLNTLIYIKTGTNGCSGNILQENIFVGKNGKIIGIPALNVATNEAKASHSLKIEKINEKDIFYLESRGLDRENATIIILESKVNKLFSRISEKYKSGILDKFKQFLK